MQRLPLEIRSEVFRFYDTTNDEDIFNCVRKANWTALVLFLSMRSPILRNKKLMLRCYRKACCIENRLSLAPVFASLLTTEELRSTCIAIACWCGFLPSVLFIAQYYTIDDMRLCAPRGFYRACQRGHIAIARFLLPFLTTKQIRAQNAFLSACWHGHLEIVHLLLPLLTIENIRSSDNGAFCNACANGQTEIVMLLMPLLSVDDMRSQNNKAFRNASSRGFLPIVEALTNVLTVSDMQTKDCEAFTFATYHGHKEIVFLLIRVMYAKNQYLVLLHFLCLALDIICRKFVWSMEEHNYRFLF